MTEFDFIASGLRTIDIEAAAVSALSKRLNGDFNRACQLILNCSGRTIVTGMGKSGHVGKKIAATLASTGSPAFFVHPGEASHGDLGMITREDVVIAISYSGSSAEIVTLLPLLKRLGITLIAMTAHRDSPLGEMANAILDISVAKEACPLALAPTASTTATLVLGDALAIALLEARGFTAEDFAFSHPGGTLGRKLLLKVADVMHTGSAIPQVRAATPIRDALVEISAKGLGMTTVTESDGRLLGVFTDGDLRRLLDHGADFRNTPISEVMHRQPRTISADALAAQAMNLMEDNKISTLVVTDTNHRVTGALHLHDLLRAGLA